MDPRLSNLELASAQMSDELCKLKRIADERADKLLELTNAYNVLATEISSLSSRLDKANNLVCRLDSLVTTIAQLVAAVQRIDQSTKVSQGRRYAANNNFRRKRKPNGH